MLPFKCEATENKIYEQFKMTGLEETFDVSSEVFPKFDSKKMVEDLASGKVFDTIKIIDNIFTFFAKEFKNNLRICALCTKNLAKTR